MVVSFIKKTVQKKEKKKENKTVLRLYSILKNARKGKNKKIKTIDSIND